MKIFLTGGTGFIGKNVIKKLDLEENKLMVLTHKLKFEEEGLKGIEIVQEDLSNKEEIRNIIRGFNPDKIIHLAWGGILEGDFGLDRSLNNFKQGLNILESLTETDCKKVIFVGSDQEYGNIQGELNEKLPSSSVDFFTTSKNCLRDFGEKICQKIGASFYWPRIFYVYGPGQQKGLIHYLVKNLVNGVEPNIKTPFTKNDFIYIDDVVNALGGLLNKNAKEGIYNIGSGHSTEVASVVKETYRLMGAKYKERELYQKEVSNRWADISKIKKEVGWSPKISIERGIQKTIEDLV